MSLLIPQNPRIIICGITGKAGSLHAQRMAAYGSNIVGGISPFRESGYFCDAIPLEPSIYALYERLQTNNKTLQTKNCRFSPVADMAVLFVPPANVFDSVCECIENKIPLIVCITEGVPAHDMLKINAILRTSNTRLIGPNSPGILSPGMFSAGIIPTNICMPGNVGIVSRSGTLLYETAHQLSRAGIGQSMCIGIGGDLIVGTRFLDIVEFFDRDENTDLIVVLGEVGGNGEVEIADKEFSKPIFSYIAGRNVPLYTNMGHAGAICNQHFESAEFKSQYLQNHGIIVADSIIKLIKQIKCVR